MTTTAPPPARTAPAPRPAPRPAPTNATTASAPREFAVTSGIQTAPKRVLVYGPGGIGKTTLASLAPKPVILDLEARSFHREVSRVERSQLETFEDLRACLQSSVLDGFETVVIDTVTRAQELVTDYVIRTVKHEKGHTVPHLEGYGFGKGLQHVYDKFLLLLQDCDSLIKRGRNVILVAHECVNTVPNPHGEDYIRYEPFLQSPQSGKADVRGKVFQWADYVLFVGYDVLSEDGKGKGAGTRTIWTEELPTHRAKRSSKIPSSLEYREESREIWDLIFGGAK